MDQKVKLVECITTWQGEGPDTGQRMLLLRFKYCNRVEEGIACSWCDTLVKMRVSLESEYSFEQIQEIVNEQKVGLMITGGEPTYARNLDSTADLLNNMDYPIANIESNGCGLAELIKRVDPLKPVNYIYSPKFFSLVDLEKVKEEAAELINLSPKVFIKVVYEENVLMDDFLSVVSSMGINNRIYLMPEGKTFEKLLDHSGKCFDAAEFYKVNFSSRQHIIFGFV